MAERRVPRTINYRLTEEARAVIALIMRLGEIETVNQFYDLAVDMMKDYTLEAMEGRQAASYDPETERIRIKAYEFLSKVTRNRSAVAERGVRKVLDNMRQFLPEDSNE